MILHGNFQELGKQHHGHIVDAVIARIFKSGQRRAFSRAGEARDNRYAEMLHPGCP